VYKIGGVGTVGFILIWLCSQEERVVSVTLNRFVV
jgi:hypothetical protein